MDKKLVNELLNKLNSKSDKQWSLNELKKMSSGIKAEDLKDESKAQELIKKVAQAAGKKISNDKAKQLAQMIKKDKISNLFKK